MSSFNFRHVIKATRWKQKKRQRKWKLLLGVSKKFRPVRRRGANGGAGGAKPQSYLRMRSKRGNHLHFEQQSQQAGEGRDAE